MKTFDKATTKLHQYPTPKAILDEKNALVDLNAPGSPFVTRLLASGEDDYKVYFVMVRCLVHYITICGTDGEL